MRTWFPYPLLSVGLLIIWLLLNQSVAPGTIVMGTILSVALGWVTLKLNPAHSHPRRILRTLRFGASVVVDVIRSNIAVMLVILRAGRRAPNSGFLTVDLDLEDENALALLACIMTATPGTAWLEYDRRRKSLLFHVLDMENEEIWLQTVKRYEAGLKEMFG
ncbi:MULTISPECIES: Na+/H+ antiporter subunit E [Ensifer]|jgi:multicomponent K+:H+ antiporter subunit E|uniref:Na+/H+ antiporter subunit E n=1 Tax=Ensifer canadensis TaxID=555315 RepID=A0AAW4FTU9_9HYPH|nr:MULTISPECIES: Na+/H+ antiporter subunit E [Ensifer]AHK42503.1 pH adaption potassium efflux system protein [Ensifer adhaerens OV14]MDP9631416.1 multicomponent K+:H+ antiporter subunit E [Ensifer adhaerens]KQU82161.1 cation:proton antiporter [Ensifer sp. Root31]KQW55475.1 cation:proton antiporter [Ensifer sp. Root1252]KQW73603.1 cation:proton antiporter [Ensifer sp. Root127]